MQAEARDILWEALGAKPQAAVPDNNLYEAIRALVEPLGGVELEPFLGQPVGEPPSFHQLE